jgi:hypothetical protein
MVNWGMYSSDLNIVHFTNALQFQKQFVFGAKRLSVNDNDYNYCYYYYYYYYYMIFLDFLLMVLLWSFLSELWWLLPLWWRRLFMPESEAEVEVFVRATHDAGQKLRVVSPFISYTKLVDCVPFIRMDFWVLGQVNEAMTWILRSLLISGCACGLRQLSG